MNDVWLKESPILSRIDPNDLMIKRFNPGDPNNIYYRLSDFKKIKNIPDNLVMVTRKPLSFKRPKAYRSKYLCRDYHTSGVALLKCNFGTEESFKLILDTGSGNALTVKGIHVLKNNLSILPQKGLPRGLCLVPKLQIGPIIFENILASYSDFQLQDQIFGIPFLGTSKVLLGLDLLKLFKYVSFDNLNKEVVLSAATFDPGKTGEWQPFSFSLKKKEHGTALMVRLPIEDRKYELIFDSGAGTGLILKDRNWQLLRNDLEHITFTHSNFWIEDYGGKYLCRKGNAKRLSIGNLTLTDIEILVISNENPLRECEGLIGLQFFKQQHIILDFERLLLWVK